jgi:hypothetical protein
VERTDAVGENSQRDAAERSKAAESGPSQAEA